jgi:hypothetical protein
MRFKIESKSFTKGYNALGFVSMNVNGYAYEK